MMDFQRLVLFVVFSFSLVLLWEAWQKDQRAQLPSAATTATAARDDKAGAGVPTPSVPSSTVPAPAAARSAEAIPAEAPVAKPHERIQITTDLVRAEIDLLGGDIVYMELLGHPDAVDSSKNLVLLGPQHRYAVQSGLIGEGLPNHKTLYTAGALRQTLEAGQDKLEVRLEASGANGVKVSKIITFNRGSYLVDVAHQVSNGGAAPLSTHAYMQITRDGKAPDGENAMMYTYTGPAMYTDQDKFLKVPFDDIDGKPLSKSAENGWAAMVQHYFVTALVAPASQQRELYTRKLGEDLYAAGVITPIAQIAPGTSQVAKFSVYAGPQEQDKLRAIAPGLELVVDYGMLAVIAVPLFWILEFFHKLSGNWGLAIIFLTVLIKLIFFPLSAASYRSMAKMKLVTPRLMKIRDQYANDRMKQNQAMMELYKEEKINPLGGCLPIVVQIPVFIALYWTLLGSVELRQAPFYGWIHDLAARDPYYILPALMMVSMIIQTKMSPPPPDPVQAKVMQIMPIVFGVMFFIFPAGLVLYWLVNNVLSITQQWYITRGIEQAKLAGTKR